LAHINVEGDKEILYPLTEEDTCLFLYKKISDIIFNLILKIISFHFLDEVESTLEVNLDTYINKCNLYFKTITFKEMLILKGYPEDYIPDELEIPEDAKLRIVDDAPDVNVLTEIFRKLT
jgi:hypothetical protein